MSRFPGLARKQREALKYLAARTRRENAEGEELYIRFGRVVYQVWLPDGRKFEVPFGLDMVRSLSKTDYVTLASETPATSVSDEIVGFTLTQLAYDWLDYQSMPRIRRWLSDLRKSRPPLGSWLGTSAGVLAALAALAMAYFAYRSSSQSEPQPAVIRSWGIGVVRYISVPGEAEIRRGFVVTTEGKIDLWVRNRGGSNAGLVGGYARQEDIEEALAVAHPRSPVATDSTLSSLLGSATLTYGVYTPDEIPFDSPLEIPPGETRQVRLIFALTTGAGVCPEGVISATVPAHSSRCFAESTTGNDIRVLLEPYIALKLPVVLSFDGLPDVETIVEIEWSSPPPVDSR